MKKQSDDIRNFLGKIRKLQTENQQIDVTNVEDVKGLLKEQKIRTTFNVITESEFQEVTPEEQREEENKFKDVVSKLVKFDKIQVYRQNVTWGGFLVREKIKWTFSLDETNGCYINIESLDMLQLTSEVIEILKKLKGYYDVWSDEWGSRLTGEPSEGLGSTTEPKPEVGQGGENKGGLGF